MASTKVGIIAAKLLFNGSEDKYELWETRFLGDSHIRKLKGTIMNEPADATAE